MTALLRERIHRPVPAEHKSNFRHLYFDIAWFGVLSGSTLSFIAVYLARIGASGFQIGLFNASPAMITLLIALPSGYWLKNKPLDRSVFWSAAAFRLFYLMWIIIPVWLAHHMQVWTFVAFSLLMSIPGTVLAISFNAMFADAVPSEWRAHVAGVRNALLALSFVITSLVCGAVLSWLPFPLDYQVVFGIGFLGAVMSTLHLWFIRIKPHAVDSPRTGKSLGDLARPGVVGFLANTVRTSVGLRFLSRRPHLKMPRTDILKGKFGKIILVLFLFHLTLYLPQALFPLYWVDQIQLSDGEISLGNALFYFAVFLGSSQLSRITDRLGHHGVMVIGAVVLFVYPTITAVMQDLPLFLVNSVVGGLGWSLAGGAVNNYLLENIPDGDRPVYLSWYNLSLNAAILLGSMAGPAMGQQFGLVLALLLAGGARLLSGLSIWRWGQSELAAAAAGTD